MDVGEIFFGGAEAVEEEDGGVAGRGEGGEVVEGGEGEGGGVYGEGDGGVGEWHRLFFFCFFWLG